MRHLDRQTEYWDRAATEKKFTHPLHSDRILSLLAPDARILDYGCGYGRTCRQLRRIGFGNVVGVDISPEMIRQGRLRCPEIELRTLRTEKLPFESDTIDAVLLFAVLTCIPGDKGQQAVVADIFRVLKPGGILYASDYPLQSDARNLERYRRYEKTYGVYGVFEIAGGAVVRHHHPAAIRTLFSDFEKIGQEELDVPTMNGNPARIFQYFGRKPTADSLLQP
jgi:ubiquinone/menaquinone biosynthesis C-methylase UbiE